MKREQNYKQFLASVLKLYILPTVLHVCKVATPIFLLALWVSAAGENSALGWRLVSSLTTSLNLDKQEMYQALN